MSKIVPPACAGSSSRWESGPSRTKPNPADTWRTAPSSPEATTSAALRMSGWTRIQTASIKNRPFASASSISSADSAALVVSGFSTRTALPAARQVRAEAR